MLENVTLDNFTPHVGQPFTLRMPAGEPLTVTLLSAERGPGDDDPRRTRAPFGLIFRLPPGHRLAQGMYVIEREGFGATDIFLVQIVPDQGGARIQAVFA